MLLNALFQNDGNPNANLVERSKPKLVLFNHPLLKLGEWWGNLSCSALDPTSVILLRGDCSTGSTIFRAPFSSRMYLTLPTLNCTIFGKDTGLSSALYKFVLNFRYVAPFGNHPHERETESKFRTFCAPVKSRGRMGETSLSLSSIMRSMFQVSDILPRFRIRAPQRWLGSKIEAKFRTFWPL